MIDALQDLSVDWKNVCFLGALFTATALAAAFGGHRSMVQKREHRGKVTAARLGVVLSILRATANEKATIGNRAHIEEAVRVILKDLIMAEGHLQAARTLREIEERLDADEEHHDSDA